MTGSVREAEMYSSAAWFGALQHDVKHEVAVKPGFLRDVGPSLGRLHAGLD